MSAPPSPYKGLAAFADTELDALLFFGREADTDVIAANLLAARFTVLYGPTGVGKSSVLRAGIARRVRALAPDAHVVVQDSWAGDAVESLWRAVTRELPGDDPPEAAPVFVNRLRTLLDQFGGHLYLVLDQFEELFVYPEAPAFAEALADVVRSDLRVHVLLAMREDALAELDVFTGRLPDVFGNHLPLDRLDRAAGAAAITGPIARYNELSGEPPVQVEPELVDAVLEEVEVGRVVLADAPRGASDAGSSGIEAPYLQLVMQRVWETERERASSVLRRSTLSELGGAQAIVRSHLDRAVGELAPREQDAAARIFNHLVTPSGTKVAHRVTDLAQYAGMDERELQPVLTSLGAERILRPLDGRFEIFHDVLADAVLAWRTQHEANRALEAQRADAERRHRRLLGFLGASLVALVAVAAIAVYALSQRDEARDQAAIARLEARRAQASGLNAEASVQIPVTPVQPDPELGLLLADEAARLAPSARGADILRRALLVSHLRRVLPDRGVTAAVLSRDGDRIVVGTAGGQVHFYERDSGRRTGTLQVGRPVTALSLSPDGRLVLTSERDSPARLWNLATRTELDSFDDSPNAAFSPDGDLLVTFGAGVGVWLTRGGSFVANLFEAEPDARDAFFGPGGSRVATIGLGRLVRVFEARTGRLVATVDQGGGVTGAAFTPDERLLVTAGQNRTARVWGLRGGSRLLRELRGHRGHVTAAAISPDGKHLVTTSTDGTARVWELPSGRLVTDLRGHTNRVSGAAWSIDGRSVVTWALDGTARVWDPETGAPRVVLAAHGGAVTSAAFDTAGTRVLTTSADGRARVWSARVDADLRTVARVSRPAAASFSADGSFVAVAGPSETQVLRSVDGDVVGRIPGRFRAVAVSRGGELAAAASGPRVSLRRVATAAETRVLQPGASVTAVAFSPDDRRVAVGTTAGTILISTPEGRQVGRFRASRRGVTSVAFSPTGDRVAAGFGNGEAGVWRLHDGRRLFRRSGHREGTPVLGIRFGLAGRRIATAGQDGTVRVWSASRGRPSHVLSGHFAVVSGVSFSPNGHWLVSAGPGTAGLWDLPTRQRLLFLTGHTGRLLAAAFDRTGRRIATVGADGTLRAYECRICAATPALLRLAESRLAATGRRLTAEERRRYLGR